MDIKIVPCEEGNFEDNEVLVDDVTISYLQRNDSSGEDVDGIDGAQKITLKTRSNGLKRFVNIQTESWSIDSVDELEKIVDDFEKRAGLKSKQHD